MQKLLESQVYTEKTVTLRVIQKYDVTEPCLNHVEPVEHLRWSF